MKKVVCILVGVLLMLALAACGSAAATDTTGQASPTAATGSATNQKAPETTATAKPSGDLGTRKNPIPIGQAAEVGKWMITVTAVTLDATAAVREASDFYEAPEVGSQYVLADLTATYNGDKSDSFMMGLMYKVVGAGGNTFDAAHASLPESIEDSNEVYGGASVSGPLVFVVTSDQVDGAVLELVSSFSFDDSVFFALK